MNRGETGQTQTNFPQQNARMMEFPWMVSCYFLPSQTSKQHFLTTKQAFIVYEFGTYQTLRSAAIINDRWLLTVANDPIINIDKLT